MQKSLTGHDSASQGIMHFDSYARERTVTQREERGTRSRQILHMSRASSSPVYTECVKVMP